MNDGTVPCHRHRGSWSFFNDLISTTEEEDTMIVIRANNSRAGVEEVARMEVDGPIRMARKSA